ncbi:hypothetical protein CBOM_03415 [Ceraceosorus bombacis]|uniref:37S ribosomal protein mrp10, mitochondrial n=1 Tax=Ceraceosorus bombacis TaxID=401625 RepID=A0A0P1BNX2_9BASI|nr:hypothetical protein CBOM_03415 [Ceraceosorus bombacis]
MKLHHLKVRPRKEVAQAPCAAEFAAMLACWASSQDTNNTGPCAASAKVLQQCMNSGKANRNRPAKSTINYHLARLSKHM